MEKTELERKNKYYEEAIESVLKETNYLENYQYAEYIIKTYINDERSYQKNRFFRVTRITNNIFKSCEDAVRFLNPVLYQEYLYSIAKNEEKKKSHSTNNLKRIAEHIKSSRLNPEDKYDILDFYRFIPFREAAGNFVSELKKFMLTTPEIDDEIYEIITSYLKENGITKIIFTTENYMLRNKSVMMMPEVSEEVIHNLFRYMSASGLPKIEHVFMILLDRYLNNEIDFTKLDDMESRSKNRKYKKYYDNPYKLAPKHK